MEKQFKPVPDVECLKYHGTPEKPDIKIFVSHRIDQDSETVDNPLYIPVRCGAVFDEREGVTMLGDDTGDNISERRESFCELTVLYWAWKNVKADYYGLCKESRYMVFSGKKFSTDKANWNQVVRKYLTASSKVEFGLGEHSKMYEQIVANEAILPVPVDITECETPEGHKKSIGQFWKTFEGSSIADNGIDILLECAKAVKPDYMEILKSYLCQKKSFNLNCFILNRKYFYELCEFMYPILFEIEKRLDSRYYNRTLIETFTRFGEILIGAFCASICEQAKTTFAQLVFFANSCKIERELTPAYTTNNIPIVLMSSNYFIPYISCLLQSIVDTSTPSHNYDIIILYKDVDERNQLKIKRISSGKSNISIRFFNASILFSDTDLYISNPEYAEEAYYRILAPWILKSYDKAIVLDGDIIAKSDISELYEIDLGDALLGAVEEIVYQGMLNLDIYDDMQYAKEELTLDDPYSYVNTGVLLLNLKMLREEFKQSDILKFVGSHKYRIQEQDAINVLFQGRIKHIDLQWNYYVETNPWVTSRLVAAPHEKYALYRSQKGERGLIHYASRPRPWDEPFMIHAEDFWVIARKTEFYEQILSRMVAWQANILLYKNGLVSPPDSRSGVRKLADKLLPKGTRRREFAKKLLPKGSRRWQFCKQIYYIFKPEYRPSKED